MYACGDLFVPQRRRPQNLHKPSPPPFSAGCLDTPDGRRRRAASISRVTLTYRVVINGKPLPDPWMVVPGHRTGQYQLAPAALPAHPYDLKMNKVAVAATTRLDELALFAEERFEAERRMFWNAVRDYLVMFLGWLVFFLLLLLILAPQIFF